MASTYIQRINGTPDSRKKFTFSVWVKRAKLGTYQYIHGFQDNGVSDPRMTLTFRDDDSFEYTEGNSSGTELGRLRPSMKFRDTSAWYAITVAVDTTLATADDRIKIWVNGEQQTSISVRVNYTQNFDTCINDNRHTIGAIYNTALSGYFDGSLSHYHYCDGYAYQASDFGETDATTGIWKPKTAPSVTYGTNGCFLKFENSGAFGTDSSGNSNNFTVNGTMTQTIDTPSNVFATLNPLQSQIGGATLSLGNTKLVTGSGTPLTGTTVATLGVSSGKFYWETKLLSAVASTMPCFAVVGENCLVQHYLTSTSVGDYVTYTPRVASEIYERYNDGSNDNNYSYGDGSTINVNDIIGCALDKDNGKVYWSINGTWINSGDPVNGTNPASSNINNLRGDFVFPAYGDEQYSSSAIFETNFGNGYFGTTAVSSAQNPDDGIGIFEYDVPAGYYALNTKAINAQEYD